MSELELQRVLILGIDALEYELVEKWNLENLKQEEYGKTELPLLPGQEPITVIIWPCFITGRMPQQMGYTTVAVHPQPIQTFMDKVYPYFRKMFISYSAQNLMEKKKSKQIILDVSRKLLEKINLSHKPGRNDIKSPTFFDGNNLNSVHLHIPVYDDDAFKYRKNTIKAIENKFYRVNYEMACLQEFAQRTQEVFEYIQRNKWHLFMQYFYVLDGIQHVFYSNLEKIAQFYIMFDEFVGKIRQQISDDTLLLVISDHGQKKGIHTHYGFYSTNKPLGLGNPRLIDFRWIVEDLLKQWK